MNGLSSAPAGPVLDRAAFEEFVDALGVDGAGATFAAFLRDTSARLVRMRELSCGRDRAAMEEEAHALKGAAGTLGMTQLCDFARRLEYSAPTVTPPSYAEQVERLDSAFRIARAEAERILEGSARAA
jgi:HPt (histidine-containing phosphotransfer) domain-containing protein